MGKVGIEKSISLDGYITGPNPRKEQPLGEGGQAIFAWMMADQLEADETPGVRAVSDEYTEVIGDTMEETGAIIMDKRMFEMIDSPDGWVRPDGYQFDWPVLVLTHEVREPVTKGKTPFTFVNDGPESALAQARAVAGDKNIGIGGGNTCQQFFRAGLVDQLTLHLVPVFLGGGVRLLDGVGDAPSRLECTNVLRGNGVTHLTYILTPEARQ